MTCSIVLRLARLCERQTKGRSVALFPPMDARRHVRCISPVVPLTTRTMSLAHPIKGGRQMQPSL